MIALLQRKGLKFFHPILKKVVKVYLSKPRRYTYRGVQLKVMPGVFHPGLFFSTKVFLSFLRTLNLKGKKLLELGAGSGLIAISCAKRGAIVTASDVNHTALDALKLNAAENKTKLEVVHSDLFEKLDALDFDIIVINPPYYQKKAENVANQAWFCGENFEYFENLFGQLKSMNIDRCNIYMILSEDCDLVKIISIAERNSFDLALTYTKKISGEKNFIYQIKSLST